MYWEAAPPKNVDDFRIDMAIQQQTVSQPIGLLVNLTKSDAHFARIDHWLISQKPSSVTLVESTVNPQWRTEV